MEWTRDDTVRLIRLLKKREILWNSRSKSYKDRKKKAIAWSEIEAELGISVIMCKKRVESLLASCRREKGKINKSKIVDEPEFVYEPKWFYWNEFKFLRGASDEFKDDDNNLESLQPNPAWTLSARRPPRKHKKIKETRRVQEVESRNNCNKPTCNTIKSQWDGDEHDAFGITVAAKLRKMDPNQRLYAENIISQTLYKGMLFQLNQQSEAEFLQPQRMQMNVTATEPDHHQHTEDQWQTHSFQIPTTYIDNTTKGSD